MEYVWICFPLDRVESLAKNSQAQKNFRFELVENVQSIISTLLVKIGHTYQLILLKLGVDCWIYKIVDTCT